MAQAPTLLPVLLASLDEAFNKRSWHGTNLRGSVRGLSLSAALWRPQPGRHNIYELVLHAAYWKYVIYRKISGAKRGSFPLRGSNFFPCPPSATQADWGNAVRLLDQQHAQLRGAVEGLTPAALKDPKTLFHIRGAAAHDLYHAGQIQLLKRLNAAPV